MTTSDLRLPRRAALLGGTSTIGDCLVALRFLASPRQLLRGPAIVEYEQAFARRVGVRYAYSFFAGRIGLRCAAGAGHRRWRRSASPGANACGRAKRYPFCGCASGLRRL